MYSILNKKKGSIVILTVIILSFISFSVFTISFLIKNQYRKESLIKEEEILEEKEKLEKEINRVYKNYVLEEINKSSEVGSIEEYLLGKNEKEIWENNYNTTIPITDSGFYIESIYVIKNSSDTREIYSKEKGTKTNYINLIKNFSSTGRSGEVKIYLKNINEKLDIQNYKSYESKISGEVSIVYFYSGWGNDLEDVERRGGKINVKIY